MSSSRLSRHQAEYPRSNGHHSGITGLPETVVTREASTLDLEIDKEVLVRTVYPFEVILWMVAMFNGFGHDRGFPKFVVYYLCC